MGEWRRDRNWSMQVTALYDYEPEQLDELGFQEGDVLRVLRVQDDGWWFGYNVEEPDVIGLFPSNYVQAQKNFPPVDAVTTPRPPPSSRQRIQQQPRRVPDTPELNDEDEDTDKVEELRDGYRGHIGAVLQLRKDLEEAERASESVRDARRQAERERLRHRKSWQEQEQDEDAIEVDNVNQKEPYYRVQANHQPQESPIGDSEDTEDEDDLAFPQLQGYMHETDCQQAEEAETGKNLNSSDENEAQPDVEDDHATTDTADAENAAATLIARGYRRHAAIARTNREIAAVCIQRWAAHVYSRQRKRRQWELEQSAARRRENEAATDIQKWIRMRWACFWRRRVQIERHKLAAREAQQTQQLEEMTKVEHQGELNEMLRPEPENERQLSEEKDEHQLLEQKVAEEIRRQVLQFKEEEEQQRRQLQLETVEEEVQLRQEEESGPCEVGPAILSQSAQTPSRGRTRRKVMKKEAVELIKTMVQQQLSETLRDHDAKMDELQRLVARLQTVVRKQTAMLEDSTNQLVNLQMRQQEQKHLMPPRSNDARSCSFLPRIAGQSSVPRQPVASSGLRAPRPVMLSKLPVLSRGGSGATNQSNKT